MSSIKTARPKIYHGSLGSIGGTALQLTSTDTPLLRGIYIKSVAANSTNFVYVGGAGVTAGVSAPTTDGYQLAANAEMFIPVDNANKVYVIGSTTGLAVSWHGE